MAIDTSNIQAFTDAELLLLWREAFAALAATGKYYMVGGRQLGREDSAECRENIRYFEERIQNAAGAESGGGIAIARFGNPA